MKRFILFLLLSTSACGGSTNAPAADDAGANAETGGADIDGTCATVAKDRCQKLGSCSPTDLTLRFGDEATCESRQKTICADGLNAPSTGATTATASACGAALTAATCAEFMSNTPVPACAAKVGALALGASCAFSGQCQSSFCNVPDGSVCGSCAALPKVGDTCTGNCGPGLHCGKTSRVCSAYAASGAPCDKDVVCDVGLGCVQAKGAAMGTCAALGMEGASCDAKSQTLPQCNRAAGLWCDTTNKCAKITTFAKKGEPCGLVTATDYAACSGGSSCVVPTGGMGKGTCEGPAALGEPCDPTGASIDCEQQLRCVGTGTSGTCASPTSCK